MAQGSVIKEYLVSLGFEIDEHTQEKVDDALDKTTKRAVGLGAAIETAAAAVAAAVVKMASDFERLYYSAQRTGSSAKDIDAFSFAVGQMGGNADAAKASVEALADKLRTNPAYAEFIKGLGVDPSQGAVHTLEQLGEKYKELNAQGKEFLTYQLSGMLGTDRDTVMAMLRGITEVEAQRKATFSRFGVDLDAVDKKSVAFMQRFRDLGSVAKAGLTNVGSALLDRLQPQIERALAWLNNSENADKLVNSITWAVNQLLNIADMIANFAGKAIKGLKELDEATDGWSTKIIAITALLVYLGGGSLFGSIISGFAGITKAIFTTIGATGLLKTGLVGLAALAGYELGTIVYDKLLSDTAVGDWIGKMETKILAFFGDKEAQDALQRAGDAAPAPAPGSRAAQRNAADAADDRASVDAHGAILGRTLNLFRDMKRGVDHFLEDEYYDLHPDQDPDSPLGLKQNNPGNLRKWGNTPIKNGFAAFDTPEAGLSAMAGNLLTYANRGWDSVQAIVSHWAPPGENNTKAYIDDITKRLGVGAGDKIDLRDPTTMASVMDALIRHEQGRDPFTQSALIGAANTRLTPGGSSGGSDVQITQRTEINVHANDAHGAGAAVADAQDQVNGNLVQRFYDPHR